MYLHKLLNNDSLVRYIRGLCVKQVEKNIHVVIRFSVMHRFYDRLLSFTCQSKKIRTVNGIVTLIAVKI